MNATQHVKTSQADLNSDGRAHDCETCNQEMRAGCATWLCLNSRTLRYTTTQVTPEREDQGWFPFCNMCAVLHTESSEAKIERIVALASTLSPEATSIELYAAMTREIDAGTDNGGGKRRHRQLIDALHTIALTMKVRS